MIKGRSDLKGTADELKRRISDIDVNLDKGTLKRAGVKFKGEVYKIWPLGFQVEIEAVRSRSPDTVNFNVTITDSRVDSPPEPAFYTTEITDSRVIEFLEPSTFSVDFLDLQIDAAVFEVSITDTRDFTPSTFDVELTELIIE